MSRALRRVGDDWERLAREDPCWAVLTDPHKRGNRWDDASFYATGRQQVDYVLSRLEAAGITGSPGAALDFGCGVGRLSFALAERFTNVTGVDISPTMLARAAAHNRFGDAVRFVHNDADDLAVLGDARFDLVLSLITLQHVPAAAARRFFGELAERVGEGGALAVQWVAGVRVEPGPAWKRLARRTVPAGLRQAWHSAVRGDKLAGRMQMNVVPEQVVRATLEDAGLRIATIEPCDLTGPGFDSRLVLATRRA